MKKNGCLFLNVGIKCINKEKINLVLERGKETPWQMFYYIWAGNPALSLALGGAGLALGAHTLALGGRALVGQCILYF